MRLHPQTKIGFLHSADGKHYLTLHNTALGHRGVVRYADNVRELLEIAHDALFREGEIEVL
jgi:predicted MarR family transcription regulator